MRAEVLQHGISSPVGDFDTMPAKAGGGLAAQLARTAQQIAQQEKADAEKKDLQRRLDGDVHGLAKAKQQGEEHKARRLKVEETRKMQEAMRARSAEASRELEMQAHALIGGMQAMGMHEEFTHTFFVSKAKALQAAFTRGQHKCPVLGSLSLGDLTQKLMYGVRASVYRARVSEQDRGIRVMRALDPKAQAREGITRVVIAENKSGSGLEATVVLNTFKELLPSGDVNLNAIRKMGGICESSRVEPPAAIFAVDLDATLATSGPMFAFLRTTATERVTILNNTEDATPIETIWTVE